MTRLGPRCSARAASARCVQPRGRRRPRRAPPRARLGARAAGPKRRARESVPVQPRRAKAGRLCTSVTARKKIATKSLRAPKLRTSVTARACICARLRAREGARVRANVDVEVRTGQCARASFREKRARRLQRTHGGRFKRRIDKDSCARSRTSKDAGIAACLYTSIV
eukprot:3936449-Pleurochrysis_carterae.AAC.1